MPILTECQSCHRKLRVPDHLLGKSVKCPACGQAFRVAAPAPPEEEVHDIQEFEVKRQRDEEPPANEDAAEEEEEERRPSRGRPRDWRKVHTGLTLALAAVVLLLLLFPAALIGTFAVGQVAMRIPLGIMGVVANLTSLAGVAFCVAAPPKHNAKTLAIVTLVLEVLSVGAAFLSFLQNPVLALLGALAGLGKFFSFLFFLRAVARCARARDLETSIGRLLILNGVLIGMAILFGCVLGAAGAMVVGAPPRQGEAPNAALAGLGLLGMGLGCITLILLIIWLFWYVRVLLQSREAVARKLARL